MPNNPRPFALVPMVSVPRKYYPTTLHTFLPLFSDNSRVYYKTGSLGSGIGSVRNSRVKARLV